MPDLYAVAFGNAFDGIQLVGPFTSMDDATDYASENDGGLPWEVVKVYAKEEA